MPLEFDYSKSLNRIEDRLENRINIESPSDDDILIQFKKVLVADNPSDFFIYAIISLWSKDYIEKTEYGVKILFENGYRVNDDEAEVLMSKFDEQINGNHNYKYSAVITVSEHIDQIIESGIDIYGLGSVRKENLTDNQKKDIQGYAKAILEAT